MSMTDTANQPFPALAGGAVDSVVLEHQGHWFASLGSLAQLA